MVSIARANMFHEKGRFTVTAIGIAPSIMLILFGVASIARAMANDPKVILADEPAGNLNSKTEQKIDSMLKDLAKNDKKSMIVVTRDSRIENLPNRITHFEDGTIKAEIDCGGD
jgi:ABC-type transport system involved in Fe-S cluster assembly fused permease/ATPase subunit